MHNPMTHELHRGPRRTHRRGLQLAVACVSAVLLSLTAWAASPVAAQEFGIERFDGEVVTQNGQAFTQAGGHPYRASARIDFVQQSGVFQPVPVEDVKNIIVDLPPGFVGNPNALPKCGIAEYETSGCPPTTQVGYTDIAGGIIGPPESPQRFPVYNMEPPPGVPAMFSFKYTGVTVNLTARVRSDSDYGVTIVAENVPQTVPLLWTSLTFWGTPGDPAHDDDRTPSGSAGAAPRAFITNPTKCTPPGVGLETKLSIDSWTNPGVFKHASFFSHLSAPDESVQAGPDSCDLVPFEASLKAAPDTRRAGAPAGFAFELHTPQNDSPDGLANAHLKKAVVRLPEGVRVSPSAADGLEACAPGQIGLDSREAPSCPNGSKVGTVSVDTPLLEDPMDGEVYLASQRDNPFGTTLALYLVARGPGVIVKLPGRVDADPQTGRLTASFDDNPQLPFERLRVQFNTGPRATLVNPEECGSYTTTSELTSWTNKTVSSQSSFTISRDGNGQPCPPQGFDPGFTAGSKESGAGKFSPFFAQVTRAGGKELGRISTILPEGALAKLQGVAVCGDRQLAEAASKAGRATQAGSSCPTGSQVGTVTVGAGDSGSPFYPRIPGTDVSGRVFLTGAHAGTDAPSPGSRQAAYGLAFEVPAVAGPFDLGTIMVRAAIYVDPTTAQVKVVSDKLPRILDGIPLQVNDVRVAVDRPGFTTTPSSCATSQVVGDVDAQDGTSARRSARYQPTGCSTLPFAPRLSLALTGRRQVTTGRHPGVQAVVKQKGVGEAGIEQAKVALPKSVALDPANAQALCEFAEGTKPDLENHCPKGSIVGRATARTPLLNRDLVGNVYFVKNVRKDRKTGNEIRTLPMIVVALRGEIAVNLRGVSSTSKDGRLVNTFAGVPDAPISRFRLDIHGGKNGILAVTRTRAAKINLCAKPTSHVARADLDGHNGKARDYGIRVKTPCARKASGKRNAPRR